ncbi:MAG: TonB-dependent receptor [Hymenobacteraceae bacterium]|nr:TonB-dependent receptor [Hymenobacteraceae bacterium]
MKKQQKNKQQIACFRQWSRKNYAVFNSLKKVVRIGTLSFSCSLLAAKTDVVLAQSAEVDNTKTIPLSEVVIGGEYSEVYSELSRVVTVIKKEEIALLPVQNLQDLLEYVMSVDLRQRGANGVQADVSIRGGSFDQVLVLLNGINFTDPQTGHHNMNVPIDLNSIDRIEILQGPGSRVLGPNAFSGAINIVTGAATKSNARAQLSGGQHGYLSQSADATLAKQNITAFAAASKTSSNGYISNTDFDILNSFAQIRYQNKTLGNINFQAGYQEKEFGANGFYTLSYPNQFEHTRTFLSSVRVKKSVGKFTVIPSLYYRRHHDRFELFRDNPASWYAGHNYHQTDVAGAAVNASYFSKYGNTTFGTDYRYEHIYSTNLGNKMDSAKDVPFESGDPDPKFTREDARRHLNWFLEHTVSLKKLTASAGVMGTYNSVKNYTFFGADISYDFTNSIKAYGTVNQSLRLPTFTDLYYVGPTNLGNPDLKPEEATTYELGLKYLQPNFKAHAAAFKRQGKNIIDWVREGDSEKWQSRNHTSVTSSGFEASAEFTPQQEWKKHLKSVKAAYTFLYLNKNSDNLMSSYVLDYLKHKVIIGIDHGVYRNFGASWRMVHQQREGQYLEFTTKQNTDYKPFTLVDLKVYWANPTVTVFAEATNLFDKQYADYGNLLQPGRWVKTGIAVRLQ